MGVTIVFHQGLMSFEVTLIGRGYGESVLVHVGDHRWILVDSCKGEPPSNAAALNYLADLGLSTRDSICCVVISHWDDDHVHGIADVVGSNARAKVVMASAFRRDDFVDFVYSHDRTNSAFSSGTSAIQQTLERLGGRTVTFAAPNRLVLQLAALSHGAPAQCWTLSPSDFEVEQFLARFAQQIPQPQPVENRRVAVSRIRNDLSTVIQVTIGTASILLGADLEEEGNLNSGWTAILNSAERPGPLSDLFKVPHHGSETGHHPRVWKEMLVEQTSAVLAPWTLGGNSLPTDADIARIKSLAARTYSTNSIRAVPSVRRDRAVARTLKEMGRTPVRILRSLGAVRFRRKVSSDQWNVECFGSACPL